MSTESRIRNFVDKFERNGSAPREAAHASDGRTASPANEQDTPEIVDAELVDDSQTTTYDRSSTADPLSAAEEIHIGGDHSAHRDDIPASDHRRAEADTRAADTREADTREADTIAAPATTSRADAEPSATHSTATNSTAAHGTATNSTAAHRADETASDSAAGATDAVPASTADDADRTTGATAPGTGDARRPADENHRAAAPVGTGTGAGTGTHTSETTPGSRGTGPAAEESALVPADAADRLRTRWREVQAHFVDDPRESVTRADELVGETVEHLTTLLAERRRALAAGWSGSAETEQLRTALRDYRTLFERLVS
ncbi:MAG TPA: hypothetical protein VK083_05910 [Nocardia sp.]|uniref:hypothetical protein n=1 Tax=Nocardia sp. TaxID=1821 RepID=UPI002B4B479E|nr:hypothetical protein [Nocardia sp.]HLS76305.1 hypothetical protein [Nocardia sp.]